MWRPFCKHGRESGSSKAKPAMPRQGLETKWLMRRWLVDLITIGEAGRSTCGSSEGRGRFQEIDALRFPVSGFWRVNIWFVKLGGGKTFQEIYFLRFPVSGFWVARLEKYQNLSIISGKPSILPNTIITCSPLCGLSSPPNLCFAIFGMVPMWQARVARFC